MFVWNQRSKYSGSKVLWCPLHWNSEELIVFWSCVLQVLDWHRLIPLTWACMARQILHLGEQRRTTASLLRKLTTASNGGVTEELSCVRSNNYVQEPECRRNLVQCLLEKQGTPVEQGSLELEGVMSSLQDMGFSNAHINELLSVRRDASLQQLLDIISEFILLGLNPEPVCVVLKKSPQLLKLPIMQMRKRSSYLRKLGLGEGTRSCRFWLGAVAHACNPSSLGGRGRQMT